MRNLSVFARRSASVGSGPEGPGREMNFCASGLIVCGTGTTRVTCAVPSGSTVQVSVCGTALAGVAWLAGLAELACPFGADRTGMNSKSRAEIAAMMMLVRLCRVMTMNSSWCGLKSLMEHETTRRMEMRGPSGIAD